MKIIKALQGGIYVVELTDKEEDGRTYLTRRAYYFFELPQNMLDNFNGRV